MPANYPSTTINLGSAPTSDDLDLRRQMALLHQLEAQAQQEQMKARLADPVEAAHIQATADQFASRTGVGKFTPTGKDSYTNLREAPTDSAPSGSAVPFTSDNFQPVSAHAEPKTVKNITKLPTAPDASLRMVPGVRSSNMALTDPEAAMSTREKAMQDPRVLAAQVTASGKPPQDQARLDRSYNLSNTAIENLRKPIADQASRMSRLVDTVNQMTPQADALIAPELMTVMAGGQGSGLRLNEAEISRVIGGRTHFQDLKAALDKWQLDPTKGLSITPSQREQIRALISDVSNRSNAKLEDINKASQSLIDTGDVDAHRRIVSDLRQNIDNMNLGNVRGSGAIAMTAPDGRKLTVPADKVAELEAKGAKRN